MPIEERLKLWIALVCGAIGGMINISVRMLDTMIFWDLLEAGLTAMLCGALGVAGKELYGFSKKKIKSFISERADKKNKGKNT